jgi:hypothetical protein
MITQEFFTCAWLWLLGPFAVASILMIFFTTNFNQHLFEILRKCGYKRKDATYYMFYDPVLDFNEEVGKLTQSDMNQWLTHGTFGEEHPKLAELLTCPGCFATQCALWLGLLTSIVVGNIWFFPIALLTWPSAGRILFKKI